MQMKDWRGNLYEEEELTEKCPCGKQAVRNVCTAEGDIGRTHWHGGVHSEEDSFFFCRKCADKINLRVKTPQASEKLSEVQDE